MLEDMTQGKKASDKKIEIEAREMLSAVSTN
jgi:hypothetical protein